MTRLVADDLGTGVAVAPDPGRLVSLVPNLSEVLWWWGLGPRLVGVTDWCVAPPRAFDHSRRVRGTKNPDTGAVASLSPDLVIANEEENRELDVQRLREAAVPVYVTRVRTVADAADSLGRLGAAVGVGRAGDGLRQSILRALDQLARPRAMLTAFCPVWRDPWMATGRASFAGDLLARSGFAVVPDDAGARYPRVDLPDVAARDPDVVLLPDEPYAFGPADRSAFDGWSARVRLIDGTALTWWGPRTPHALGDLARLARSLRRRRVSGSAA